MNKTTITLVQAVSLLTEVVKRFGASHKATTPEGGEGCVYLVKATPNGLLTPVCIVGQVFSDLGILRAMLTDGGHDQHEACNIGSTLWENATAMGVEFTEEAQVFLRDAQRYQDSVYHGGQDKSWGGALTFAVGRAQENFIERAKQESGLFDSYLTHEVKQATAVSLIKSS